MFPIEPNTRPYPKYSVVYSAKPLPNSINGYVPSHTESRFAVGLSVRPDYFQSETEGNRSDPHRSRT
jgi:hypothetical protein